MCVKAHQVLIHFLMHLHSVYYLGQGESKCFNIKIFKFFVIAQPNIEHNSGVKCLLATENIEYLTLFSPAYFWNTNYQGGGHMAPAMYFIFAPP